MPFRFMDNRKKSVRLKRKRDTVGSKLWQIQNAVLTVNEVSPLLNISSTSNKSNQSPSVYLLHGQNTHISRNRVNTVISGLTASSFWLYQTRFFKGFFFINQRKQSVNFSLNLQIPNTWSLPHLAETVMDWSENSHQKIYHRRENPLCKCVSLHIFHL